MDAFDWQRLRAVGSDVKKEVAFAAGVMLVGGAVAAVVCLMGICITTDRIAAKLNQIAQGFATLDDMYID